jgi:hypothetical protein
VSVFERRYREALLARYPAWREPGRLLGPARGRRRGPRLWPAAAVAVAAALVALAVRPPAGGTGTPARLVAWPAGLTAGARLTLGSTRLVAYQAGEAAAWTRTALPRPVWTLRLKPGSKIRAVAALPSGTTVIAYRRGHALWAAVVGAEGRLKAQILLTASAPAGDIWVQTTPWSDFLVSTRTSTWILGAGGRMKARLTGGSDALAWGAAPAGIVTWNPATSALVVWTGTGRRLWTVREPHGLQAAILVPVDTGPGFAFVTPRQVIVPYPIGLTPEPKASGGPWQYPPGLVTEEALVRSGPKHLETTLWAAPGGVSLPALPPGHPLALTGNGVVITLANGTLRADTLGGRPLGAIALSASSVVAGERLVYAATPRGILVWGPFRLSPVPAALSWSGAAGPWTAVFRLQRTRAPLVVNGGMTPTPRIPQNQVMIPFGVPYIAAGRPGFVTLAGTLTLGYRGPDQALVTTLALQPPPTVSWFFAVPNPVEMSAPHLLLPAAGGAPGFQQTAEWQTTPLVWEAMRRGWISMPARFRVTLGWGTRPGPLSWVPLTMARTR